MHDLATRFSSDASKALIALIIITFLLSNILIGLRWKLRIIEKKFEESSDASIFTQDSKKLRNYTILCIVLGLIHVICFITVVLLALGIDNSVQEIALYALKIPFAVAMIWLFFRAVWYATSTSSHY